MLMYGRTVTVLDAEYRDAERPFQRPVLKIPRVNGTDDQSILGYGLDEHPCQTLRALRILVPHWNVSWLGVQYDSQVRSEIRESGTQ
jgi:hypothetical protein